MPLCFKDYPCLSGDSLSCDIRLLDLCILFKFVLLGFTLEAKLVSSKDSNALSLKIFRRFVENMASHWLTKYII